MAQKLTVYGIAYIRVSTDEQNPENQRRYIEKWSKERGITILKYYVDWGVSGATNPLERETFSEMLKEVEHMNPRPQVLVVYEISRLVRSFSELFTLLDLLENKYGLLVVSASEREQALQNLDGVYRQFLRAVLAFVANMEREFIRQRTKSAMERLKSAGAITNVVERKADIVPLVVEMYKSGKSLGEIARELGLSTYAVRRMLISRQAYHVDNIVCPRCLHKMKVIERSLKQSRRKTYIQLRLYCSNCGYERVFEES